MTATSVKPTAKLDRSGINRIFQVLGSMLVIGAVLFASAGRLAWLEAWAFLGIYLAGVTANGIWTLRHDPGLINERGRVGENTKAWDKLIGLLYMILLLITMVVAGLDARFGWSVVSLMVKIIGGICFVLSLGMVFWVMTANTYMSTFVRIQDDRGHHVVTHGPYPLSATPCIRVYCSCFWASPFSWVPGGRWRHPYST